MSREYGLFATYPLHPEETLGSVAADTGVSADLLKRFNPSSDFDAGSGIVFLPAKGECMSLYLPLGLDFCGFIY